MRFLLCISTPIKNIIILSAYQYNTQKCIWYRPIIICTHTNHLNKITLNTQVRLYVIFVLLNVIHMSGLSRVRFVELRGFSTVLQMLLLPDSFPRGTTGQAALLMFRIASSEEIPAADARTALVALVRALKQQQVRYV